jgi:molybdopterin biosynthesis enzyme
MGDLDLVKPCLAENGEIFFGRLNMKPGKPTTFGKLGNCLVFALPGNPVSSFVTCKLFLPLAIGCLKGHQP